MQSAMQYWPPNSYVIKINIRPLIGFCSIRDHLNIAFLQFILTSRSLNKVVSADCRPSNIIEDNLASKDFVICTILDHFNEGPKLIINNRIKLRFTLKKHPIENCEWCDASYCIVLNYAYFSA